MADSDDDKTTDDAAGSGSDGSGGTGDGSSGSGDDTSGRTDDATDSGTDSDSVESLQAKLAAANREAAKYRKERNTAKNELDKLKDAELSDLEREKKRADDAETKLQESMSRVRDSNLRVAIAQSDSNIVDVETATMLLNKRGLEFDNDGEPIGIKDALTTLVSDKPFLVGKATARQRTGGTNGGAGNDEDSEGSGGLTADELIMAKSFHMKPEEYAKWRNKK